MHTMANHAALIADYRNGPAQLRAACAGLTPAQLTVRPIAGKWSILEVVCHIADFEPILAERMKRTIALPNATFLGADENDFVTHLAYHDRDLNEELDLIDGTRRQMVRILAKLPASAFERTGSHNERGPRTLEQQLQTAINHIPHHLKFIAEKRQALGLPA